MSLREAQVFFGLCAMRLSAAYSPDATALQVPERFGGIEVLTPTLVRTAKSRNLRVDTWTINDEETMRRLVREGVDGIVTDRPDRLLDLRGRAGG